MTIIVTGGAGFIGSNFIFYMLKRTSTGSHRMSGFPDLCGQFVHARTGDGSAEFSFRKTRYLRPSGEYIPFLRKKNRM